MSVNCMFVISPAIQGLNLSAGVYFKFLVIGRKSVAIILLGNVQIVAS